MGLSELGLENIKKQISYFNYKKADIILKPMNNDIDGLTQEIITVKSAKWKDKCIGK